MLPHVTRYSPLLLTSVETRPICKIKGINGRLRNKMKGLGHEMFVNNKKKVNF
jgi:hypothetical protein